MEVVKQDKYYRQPTNKIDKFLRIHAERLERNIYNSDLSMYDKQALIGLFNILMLETNEQRKQILN